MTSDPPARRAPAATPPAEPPAARWDPAVAWPRCAACWPGRWPRTTCCCPAPACCC
ncbi:hypothetical protein V2I01_02155 [Micromonospora sp. BRA006-A]|nr:hypothetical protein [Micromonospora sp. BRA006-A]